jgi:hypothetical protein
MNNLNAINYADTHGGNVTDRVDKSSFSSQNIIIEK